MNYKVEHLEDLGKFCLAEGPHWDAETQSLYFVDTFQHAIHKYVPSTKQHTSVKLDKTVSFVIPIYGCSNKFLIGKVDKICIITWDGQSSKPSNVEVIAKLNNGTKINDAKADSLGHLWTGSLAAEYDLLKLAPSIGQLYSLSSDRKLKAHADNVGLSNGIAFSHDLKKLYHADSGLKAVHQYDYDVQNQTISNCQVLFSFENDNLGGLPDGQAIDEDGNLWIAVFYGCKVIKISTTKPQTLLCTVDIPDQQVTSVAFGGPNLDELYVTTGELKVPGSTNDKPTNGYLYKVTNLGTKGVPGYKVKI